MPQLRPSKIRVGDTVLLKHKTTNAHSIYDPDPYIVTQTWGTQIEAERDFSSSFEKSLAGHPDISAHDSKDKTPMRI